ncbi:MAG: hypothetical protein IMHGJWDQ_000547 [Candidatus Fervidibacter sp.]
MIVRCFEGRSMPEVMERVRREMGEDAVILHTQQRRSFWAWLRRLPTVRVWAAIAPTLCNSLSAEASPLNSLPLDNDLPSNDGRLEQEPAETSGDLTVVSETLSEKKRTKRGTSKGTGNTNAKTQRRLRSALKRSPEVSAEFADFAVRVEQQLQLLAVSLWGQEGALPQAGALGLLWKCGVDLTTIQHLLRSHPPAPDGGTTMEKWLHSLLCQHLPVTGGLAKVTGVAVLVGPTGVGKTTTVAKIAAHQLMQGRRRVALVTVDVFRIGAVQQLETYARLMGLPFFVATLPEEAERCIRQARQVADLILVDTIGRSPKHTEQLSALWELVSAMHPDEVLLTLPANGNPPDLALAAEQFSIFCPTSLIFTKLDEATQPGVMVNLVTKVNLPVAYITTGQNVPEDLEVPTSERLAEWVLLPVRENRMVLTALGEVIDDA